MKKNNTYEEYLAFLVELTSNSQNLHLDHIYTPPKLLNEGISIESIKIMATEFKLQMNHLNDIKKEDQYV